MNRADEAWMDFGNESEHKDRQTASSLVAISSGKWDNVDNSRTDARQGSLTGQSHGMKLCPICATTYPAGHRTCPTHGTVLIDTPELPAGTMIRDCYRIERMLGKGGMGTVYLAEHTLMGEPRALKFLSGALAANPTFVQRFVQEARAASRLRHPNIAQTLELGQTENGSFFISMEYVDGPSLRALLEESPQGLPPERVFNIVRGVAEALDAAHAKHIVHRDIKPENILLAWTPEAEIAKVVDFGIVAMTDSVAKLTQAGRPLLTAEYAAPEQWRGTVASTELDGRTDLYALGCMFYEMLTGSLPFHADTYEGWFEAHVYGVPEPPSKRVPDLARYAGLDAVVLSLLAKDREQRPANVRQFLQALNRVVVPATGVPDAILPKQEENTRTRNQTVIETPTPYVDPRKAFGLEAGHEEKLVSGIPPKKAGMPRTQKVAIGVLGALLILTIVVIVIVARKDKGSQEEHGVTNSTAIQLPSEAMQQSSAASEKPSAAQSAATSGTTPDTTALNTTGPSPNPGPAAPVPSGSTIGNTATASIAATVKQATTLYNAKQYAEAQPLFLNACNAGDADSCDYLGWMYQYHQGVTIDLAKSEKLYDKACQLGSLAACNNLGSMYQEHLGVAQDYAKANALYSKACDGGMAAGCNNLGSMYESKLGVAQDFPKAVALYSKACDKGSLYGCKNLGWMYEYKLGVDQDYPKAITLYTKACEGSVLEACNNLGWMYQNKMGAPQDEARASTLYGKACDGGYLQSCNNLGYMYQHARGVPQSYPRALALYAKACDGSYPSACNNLGVMYQDKNGVDQDYGRAAQYYNRACTLGDANGCSDLGDLYRKGNGVPQDNQKARSYLSKGCTMGNKWGCERLKQVAQ